MTTPRKYTQQDLEDLAMRVLAALEPHDILVVVVAVMLALDLTIEQLEEDIVKLDGPPMPPDLLTVRAALNTSIIAALPGLLAIAYWPDEAKRH